ncbi:MAG: FHA domain-containing protein [Acidimicrobiales bacterium]
MGAGLGLVAVFCHNCGHRNPEDSNFCSSCGSALSVGPPSETTIALHPVDGQAEPGDEEIVVPMPAESGAVVLVVKQGPNAGARFTLQTPLTRVGRHPESDIFLDDITVSRRHAEFSRDGAGTTTVRDVGSLNGTYVNRERIEEMVLRSGDEVQVGKFKLVFVAPE